MKVEELVKELRALADDPHEMPKMIEEVTASMKHAADWLEAQAKVVAAAHRLMQREDISAWVDMRRALGSLAELEKQ